MRLFSWSGIHHFSVSVIHFDHMFSICKTYEWMKTPTELKQPIPMKCEPSFLFTMTMTWWNNNINCFLAMTNWSLCISYILDIRVDILDTECDLSIRACYAWYPQCMLGIQNKSASRDIGFLNMRFLAFLPNGLSKVSDKDLRGQKVSAKQIER